MRPQDRGAPRVPRGATSAGGLGGAARGPHFKIIGHSVRRTDALEKVTGRARYLSDLELPGMAHARLLRSPFAAARIVRIDGVERARAVPGVYAVLSAQD